jgi:UPF0755 protein
VQSGTFFCWTNSWYFFDKKASKSYIIEVSKNLNKIIITVIILSTIVAAFVLWNNNINSASPDLESKNYILEVKEGDNFWSVGNRLADDRALNLGASLWINSQLSDKFILQPGKYSLSFPATPSQVLSNLKKQSESITAKKVAKKTQETTTLTIKEGDTVDKIIQRMDDENLISKIETQKIVGDPLFFKKLKNKYEFLPEPLSCNYGDTSTCAKYYIEGYLYPDTYEYFTNDTPETIFSKILDNFELKVWNKVKDNVKDKAKFHKAVIMASVIEKETNY